MNQESINKEYSFGKDIEIFVQHIESLATTLPIVLKTIEQANKNCIQKRNEFLNKECEKKVEEGREFYVIKPEHRKRNQILKREAIQSKIAHKIIKRNFIVSLVSQFDTLIGSFIRTMYYIKPEKLNNSEKQLTFANLVKFNSIEEARAYIIDKEIEGVLRENHTKHFEWLENKLGITLRKDLEIWPTFIELTERRNLYVHNDGKVSSQYLKVCDEHKVVFKKRPQIGDELDVNLEYFENAFKCIFELGVKLSQVLWRQLDGSNLQLADESILNTAFDLLDNKQYELAKIILDFAHLYIKKYSSEDIKLRLLLNRAQAYKWLKDEKTCKEIIESKDWSASSDIFKLASFVLIDDYVHAIEMMKKLGKESDDIDGACYKDWPIFKEFRKSEEFKKAYLDIYGQEFEITESMNEEVRA